MLQINLLRCLIVPVAYYAFLVYTQSFLTTSNDLGLGTPAPIKSLAESFSLRSGPFYWIDSTSTSDAGAGAGADGVTPAAIIERFAEQLELSQRSRIQQIATPRDLAFACPQTFVGLSPCFGAVQFNSLQSASGSSTGGLRANYTLRFDPGLITVRVSTHSSDVEKYHLPVQLALDRSLLSVTRGISFEQAAQLLDPLEQPFTRSTNAEQNEQKRISLLQGINELVVLAFLIGFLGVPYHLASDVSAERGAGMADLLTSFGCWQPARLLAWLAGPAAAYLPAYVCMAGLVAAKLWTRTSPAVAIFGLLLQGLALGSFTLFLAMFFRRSNLSAIVATAFTLILAIVALISYTEGNIGQGGMIVLGLLFPPMNFVYFFISVGLFEIAGRAADLVQRPPFYATAPGQPPAPPAGAAPLALILMSLASIFLFFALALLVERAKFYPDTVLSVFLRRRKRSHVAGGEEEKREARFDADGVPLAVSLRELTKQYSKKADSLAVDRLSFDVQQGSLTYLLGGNGSGKSTTIGMLSGTIARTSGEARIFGMDRAHLPPGVIGLCPQKDVLYAELTTTQHVRLFAKLKGSAATTRKAQIAEAHDLLQRCDLGHKLRARPSMLSGGQRRKLCLSTSLAGQSKLILCDEATSGLDPLSRRAIWKILLAQRHHRTVIATTHHLDEADFLADEVKLLAAPGKLLAEGDPVTLRRRIGDGVNIHVHAAGTEQASEVLAGLLLLSPTFERANDAGNRDQAQFTLTERDADSTAIVDALEQLEKQKRAGAVLDYDCVSASIENVFLKLNIAHERDSGRDNGLTAAFAAEQVEGEGDAAVGALSDGRPRNFAALGFVQFLKRMHILRRSWIGPVLAVILSILGSIAALTFLRGRDASCVRGFSDTTVSQGGALYSYGQVLVAPASLIAASEAVALPGVNTSIFQGVTVQNFTETFSPSGPWQQISLGGILGEPGQAPVFAYAADTSGPIIPIGLLSLIDNVLIAQAGGTPLQIVPSFQPLSRLSISSGLGTALRWAIIFALVQAVWPAFATLYPSQERRSGAKAMLLTNGQRPLPLWLGHLLAEIPVIILATVPVAVVYGVFQSGRQFESVGLLWVCLFLYGIAGTLQSFLITHFTPNPLAAFAVAAAWGVLAQLIYIAIVLSALTFITSSNILGIILQVNWAVAIVSPSVSLTRASWVSANLFNLLCDGRGGFSNVPNRALEKFGGPILYLVLWILVAGALTVFLDEGIPISLIARKLLRRDKLSLKEDAEADLRMPGAGVAQEAQRANDPANSDILKVQHLTHNYGPLVVVDDVSFSLPAAETFALVGVACVTEGGRLRADIFSSTVRTEWRGKEHYARVHSRPDPIQKRQGVHRRHRQSRAKDARSVQAVERASA